MARDHRFKGHVVCASSEIRILIRPMPMALREITQAICYLLYMLLGRVLFPPIYLARVVDGRTHRPVAGVKLVLEARDERMMLPGYPCTEAVSDSAGIITGVMAVGLG